MKSKWHYNFNHVIILSTIIISTFILGGCATMKAPAFNVDTSTIDISKESIALITVKISNEYRTSYQPDIKSVFVWNNDKGNEKKFSFGVNEKFNSVENSFNEYLVSFQLPAGTYILREMYARSGGFPVMGHYSIPIYSSFSIQPKKIIYLGHIEANIKERTGDKELRAGSVIPLIDQAVTGASGGTFVVKISDLFESDIELFKEKYPFLSQHQIDNLTLPPWKLPIGEDMQ